MIILRVQCATQMYTETLVLEGETIVQTVLQSLLDESRDSEVKGYYCLTLNAVMAASGSKILVERRDEFRPVLNKLKDEFDDEDVRLSIN